MFRYSCLHWFAGLFSVSCRTSLENDFADAVVLILQRDWMFSFCEVAFWRNIDPEECANSNGTKNFLTAAGVPTLCGNPIEVTGFVV